MTMNTLKLGKYRHFKGNEYQVVALAKHSETLEDMELVMIRRAIDKHQGNLSAVASQLGITRQTLYNKMKKYGL